MLRIHLAAAAHWHALNPVTVVILLCYTLCLLLHHVLMAVTTTTVHFPGDGVWISPRDDTRDSSSVVTQRYMSPAYDSAAK